MNWDVIIWFGLFLAFIVVEASCPFHLVSIWFAAGSLVAIVVSLLGGPVWLQVALFLVVSCLLLVLLWPLIKKFINPKLTKTNVDAIVDSQGIVTAAIDNVLAAGRVKLGGMEWTARSTTGDPIPEGTLVRVDKVEGVKVFVTPAAEAAKV